MHPAEDFLTRFPAFDFAVLAHGFPQHGRDYHIVIQHDSGTDSGTHEIAFTHCVRVDYETRVPDDVWHVSWADVLTDYEEWKAAGYPAGHVWGTNWSNAYPGLKAIHDSELASEWTSRLGKEMFEITLQTGRFVLRLIFHAIVTRKVSDEVAIISQVSIPAGPPGPSGRLP